MLLDQSGEQKIIYFIKAIIVNSWVLTFLKIGFLEQLSIACKLKYLRKPPYVSFNNRQQKNDNCENHRVREKY